MTENIRKSIRTAVTAVAAVLACLAGIWWGLRMGGGIYYLSGANFRVLFCVLMTAALLIQGYSNLKKNRKYTRIYRIFVWFSGVMVALLLYGLFALAIGDIAVVILRSAKHIQCIHGYSAFHLAFFGVRANISPVRYRRILGSSVWNFDNSSLFALAVSIILTVYGILHAKKLNVSFYRIPAGRPFPDTSYGQPDHIRKPKQKNGRFPSVSDLSLNPGISANAASCRIIQLSDLHIGSIVGYTHIRKVLQRVSELKPDYIVITGDIFNHGFAEESSSLEEIEMEFRLLNQSCRSRKEQEAGKDREKCSEQPFSRENHIFAVLGNHDPLPDDPELNRFLKNSGITLLNDQIISLPEFDLAGRNGNHLDNRRALSSWLSYPADEKPHVLLDHYPDGIYEAMDTDVSLMLSGHTHGGQYFPCNFLIRKKYSRKKGLLYGYSEWKQTKSVVSSGSGYFQIPVRIGTGSEIVCIDLVSSISVK